MIIHTNTVRFIQEVLENGEYSFLFKDQTVIDIGCNTGSFSLYMQPLARQIYSVDISEECLYSFEATIIDNGYDNIDTYLIGISGTTGTQKIRASGEAHKGGWQLDEAGDKEIDTYTLNDFMNKFNIEHADVVKLDVEGGEIDIVEAKDFPKNRINTLLGETHGTDHKTRVETALRSYGYTLFDVGGSHFLARK